MNNFEKIKEMKIGEVATFLAEVNYENGLLCSGCKQNKLCTYLSCIEHVKQWLLKEVEDE